MSKVSSRVTVFAAFLLLFVACAGVAASAKKLTRLYLHLGDKRLSIGDYKTTGAPFDDEAGYTVRSDETVEVWVQDWNPLIWSYATAVKSEQTADYEAAVAFGQVIKELLVRFPGTKASSTVAPVTVEGLDLVTFRDNIIAVQDHIGSLGALIDQSLDPAKVADMQDEARGSVAAVDAAEAGYAKAIRVFAKCLKGEALSATNGATVSCDDPYDPTPIVNLHVAASAHAIAAANHAEAVAKYAGQTSVAITDTLAALSSLETKAKSAFDAARQAAAEARVNATSTGQTIRLFLTGVLAMESRITENGTILRAFAKDAADVGPHKIATRPYSQEKQTLTLTVTAEKKYQSFMSKAAKARQEAGAAKVAIIVEPDRPFTVRPGAAFIMGFLRNPTYTIEKNGDQFKIIEKSTDLARYNVAAMLNIYPKGSQPTAGWFLQTGVSPKSDETGFYFGAGMQLEGILTFGGGLMLQQVRRLGDGLSPGSLLAKPEDLKVDLPFRKAFYVHATFALPGGK